MIISFFEEFPTSANLEKLKLISFPSKLYLASPSLKEFLELKKKINQRYNQKNKIKEFIYWPVLTRKEGYWISPFSSRTALNRILIELKDQTLAVMLDLELPTTQNPILYLTQFFNFHQNKKLIKDFILDYRGTIYLAEYYPEGKNKERILQYLGLHYSNPKLKIIKMIYHSLHRFINQEFLEKEFKRGVKEYGKNYLIALGTIAPGIHGTELKISLEQLEQDLKTAQKCRIKEAVLYRLSGLNQKYLQAIRKAS